VERLPDAGYKGFIEEVLRKERDGIHIFCGTQRYQKIAFALRSSLKMGLHSGVMAEPPINQGRGAKSILKAVYLMTLPIMNRRIPKLSRFLLGISSPKDPSFARLGWPEAKVFPFGYFSSFVSDIKPNCRTRNEGPPHIVYVGRIVPHKGLSVLIGSLALLKHKGVSFRATIYGNGSFRGQLERQIGSAGLTEQVSLPGAVAHDEIPLVLAQADVYVAPGISEPWGLTVNEAIQMGTPVVVSRGVRGGSALVEVGKCGSITQPGDIAGLGSALESLLLDSGERERVSRRCLEFASKLTPKVAAGYLCDVLDFVAGNRSERPFPLWFTNL
jgi:glycosyltransferase involved in cell wall biosynthesis